MIEILYQDEHLIAINKPHGLLVHRSAIATNTDEYAVQILRDQIGRRVNPIHRLDRKTSGVLLFSFESETTKIIQEAFHSDEVRKEYVAIVRGHFPNTLTLDYAMTNDRGKLQDALTEFRCIAKSELPIPLGKWPSSRYSLVEAIPKTGRQHQIRKHLSHLNHPIIGDRPHGCNKQNRHFKAQWDMTNMLLCAVKLSLNLPYKDKRIEIIAPLSDVFLGMQQTLELSTL